MLLYWTVIRRAPTSEDVRSEWVRAVTALAARGTATALTNAGYSETLAVFRGRHFNRLDGM